MITDDHIAYIINDLTSRGIIEERIQAELADHLCEAVEREMRNGRRFIEAYHLALGQLGHSSGLRRTQLQIIRSENPNARIMLRNYITIAWRNISRQKFYTLINVLGLAVGIAACLLIGLYICDELQYDRYNDKADRIYRVEAHARVGGNESYMTYRSASEASDLQEAFPEIERTVRFCQQGSYLIKTADGNENIKESNVIWTDSTFFEVFSVRVIDGDAATALAEPYGVAISSKMAQKYYPGKSALGETIILDNVRYGKVTAVFEVMPSASHFHFDILVSLTGDWPVARAASKTDYLTENFITYLLLKPGARAKALEAKLARFTEKHLGDALAKAMGGDFTFKKFLEDGNRYDVSLRPLTDIHLYSNVKGEFEPNGSITYVYLFGTVCAIILVIACINFMNLSTARSSTRAREVGIRKVMGSLRNHLVRQFLTESFVITLFAFVCAVVIAWAILPVFNQLAQKDLVMPFTDPVFVMLLIAACVLIGVVAGIYPAFILSAFKPVKVLKSSVVPASGNKFVRSALVVFQFSISIALIIGASVVKKQLDYIQQKNIGFQKDQVIVVRDAYALRPNGVKPFKDEVTRLGGIVSGTISGYVPVEIENVWRNNNTFWEEGKEPTGENIVAFQSWSGDHDYIRTFGIELIAGREFSTAIQSDEHAVIINESAAKRFGMKDPIGKRIIRFDVGATGQQDEKRWTIVGVIRDFHFTTMKESITPLGIFLGETDGCVSFRFETQDARQLITDIEKIWKRLAPGQPFNYSFLDADFENMYRSEDRLAKVFMLFAGLAIVIACLGLFALTAFSAEQRTREIGIRKVLGATVNSIVVLLSKEFGRLIVIAFCIAAPITFYAADWWLASYAYKTTVGISLYAFAGVLTFVIALATMSFQSIKAALANPAKSLRNE